MAFCRKRYRAGLSPEAPTTTIFSVITRSRKWWWAFMLMAAANETGTIIDKMPSGQAAVPPTPWVTRGVWASNQANLTISSNTVTSLISTFGIGSDTDPTAGIIINRTIATANIFSNNVNGIRNTNVAGWQSFIICLQSSSANAAVKCIITSFMPSRVTVNLLLRFKWPWPPAVPDGWWIPGSIITQFTWPPTRVRPVSLPVYISVFGHHRHFGDGYTK